MSFAYSQAATLADAARAVQAPEAKLLAGGQSLLGAIKLGLSAPDLLVDLNALPELKGISLAGRMLSIGAMTLHADVAASSVVQKAIPALADLAGRIGDRQVRNRGTLGGSLANNDPAACYPAALLGLGGEVQTNQRVIHADDFFLGLYETALNEGEIIQSLRFSVPDKAAWQKFKQPASRFSLVGVFVSRSGASVRVAVTGAGPCAFRVPAMEKALAADWSAAAAQKVAVSANGLLGDLHGSAAYRAALIPVLAGRAVQAAG